MASRRQPHDCQRTFTVMPLRMKCIEDVFVFLCLLLDIIARSVSRLDSQFRRTFKSGVATTSITAVRAAPFPEVPLGHLHVRS